MHIKLNPNYETALIKNRRVAEELSQSKAEIEALSGERKKLQSAVGDLEKNNAAFKAHIETLSGENHKFQENNRKLEEQVNVMTGENDRFKANNEKLEQENAKFQENNKKLEEQVFEQIYRLAQEFRISVTLDWKKKATRIFLYTSLNSRGLEFQTSDNFFWHHKHLEEVGNFLLKCSSWKSFNDPGRKLKSTQY